MLGAAPGFDCYRAAAAVIETGVRSVPANAGVNAAGAVRVGAADLAGNPMLELRGVLLPGSLHLGVAAPQLNAQSFADLVPAKKLTAPVFKTIAPAIFPNSIQAAPERDAVSQTVFQGLAKELPEFGKMDQGVAKGGSDRDFMGRIGSYQSADENTTSIVPAYDAGAGKAALDNQPVSLIVEFVGAKQRLSKFVHLSLIDVRRPNGVNVFARSRQDMRSQIAATGLEVSVLDDYGAEPLATYPDINRATIRVEAGRAAEFRRLLESRGFHVEANARREIVKPVPIKPEDTDPAGRGTVPMDENLKITKADAVQAIAQKAWGVPELGFVGRLLLKVLGVAIPQPPVGVIDTGADIKHPLLKRVKAVVNATSGPNMDEHGHGSWVTSMILNYAPWLKNLTHYKVFTADGGATLDDILKALALAHQDGNIIVSNSWGSDDGDPHSADSDYVRKLAEMGHIMVFAAGNAGPGANTIGSPAIVQYKDAKTGAIRVLAVAATDRNKKVAYFSSRGPGSPKTADDPNYQDHRPDLAAVGYNTDGAWPTDKASEADRVDPVLGPIKAISGTSMSTPSVAGGLALLAMIFGVTTVGEKLDALVTAVMGSLVMTGQSPDNEGQGFVNWEAAFLAAKAVLQPVIPGLAARFVLRTISKGVVPGRARVSLGERLRRGLHDFLGLHRWTEAFNTGVNSYWECAICGSRKVVTPDHGVYQPIDQKWLEGRK